MTDEFARAAQKSKELLEIMARLRRLGGCHWDGTPPFPSIKPYLLEETYEVLDTIDARDWRALSEELGDLLLQPVFFAEMAREQNLFSIADSLDAINQKLIRRHPHIFGDALANTAEEVKARWDEIKKQEKAERGAPVPPSVLDEVPRNLPALVETDKIGGKVARFGFEWPDVDGVLAKLQEEAVELAEAHRAKDSRHIEHELGDLLFNVVNLARYLKIDSEQALRKANGRFRQRFAYIERQLAESGSTLDDSTLSEMEELWQAAKRLERRE